MFYLESVNGLNRGQDDEATGRDGTEKRVFNVHVKALMVVTTVASRLILFVDGVTELTPAYVILFYKEE